MKQLSRHLGLDLLRVFCIFAVVFTHVNTIIASPTQFVGGFSWWIASFLHAVAQPAVPVFFMLSGYMLIQKKEKLAQHLQRLWWRILVPLLVWHGVFMLWSLFGYDQNQTPITILQTMFLGGYSHLYFLWQLAFAYLCLPFIKTYSAQKHLYLSIALLVLGFVAKLLIMNNVVSYPFSSFISLCAPIGYVNLGAWFAKKEHTERWSISHSFLLISSFVATTFLSFVVIHTFQTNGSIFWSIKHGNFAYHASQPLVIVSAFLIFLFFSYQLNMSKSLLVSKVVRFLSPLVFGTYLIHLFILRILDLGFQADIDRTSLPLLVWLAGKYFLVLGISLFCSFVLNSLPVIKQIVGNTTSKQ